MTQTQAIAAAKPAASRRDVLDELRACGHRVTAARVRTLDALFAAERPLTAEEVADGLPDGSGGDLASAYRTLETLERLGFVRHVHLGHGAGLYALVGRHEREYLVCERCGTVRSVAPVALDDVRATVQRRFGFVPRFSHFPLSGVCGRCRADDTTS